MQYALIAAQLAANTRCENVVLLDLRGRSPVTQFFLITTGTSARQMRTVADELATLGKQLGYSAWRTNGYESARWILIDFVTIVVHIFDPESRDFYDLELLWGDCPRIDWRAELGLPPASEQQVESEMSLSQRFALAAGAAEEEAMLEEQNLDEPRRRPPEEEPPENNAGDGDLDEDAEAADAVVVEFPDESTGANSVAFVEIESPANRDHPNSSFPATLHEAEDTEFDGDRTRSRPMAKDSLDEDEQEAAEERIAGDRVDEISPEDLPESQLIDTPMGGVSIGMSSTTIVEDDEDQQRDDIDLDQAGENREDAPPAYSATGGRMIRGNTDAKAKPAPRRTAKTAPASKRSRKTTPPRSKAKAASRAAAGAKTKPAARRAPVKNRPTAKSAKATRAKTTAAKATAAKNPAKKKVAGKTSNAKRSAAKKPVVKKSAATRGKKVTARAAPAKTRAKRSVAKKR